MKSEHGAESLTGRGFVQHTPGYIAPEQILGGDDDPRGGLLDLGAIRRTLQHPQKRRREALVAEDAEANADQRDQACSSSNASAACRPFSTFTLRSTRAPAAKRSTMLTMGSLGLPVTFATTATSIGPSTAANLPSML